MSVKYLFHELMEESDEAGVGSISARKNGR